MLGCICRTIAPSIDRRSVEFVSLPRPTGVEFPSPFCLAGATSLARSAVSFSSNSCQLSVGVMSKMDQQTKSVVSVAEMARMVGLSRQRFYQLLGSTFPFPLYWIATRRPFYPEDLQEVCLEVRRRNCGINGRPVLFYCGYPPRAVKPKAKPKPPQKRKQYVGLINGLAALGLPVKEERVAAAVKQLYPNGVDGKEDGEVLRDVFLHLKRQDSGDKVGR